MKISLISDTHQHHNKIKMPDDSDLIIHAGDFTYRGEIEEVQKFIKWYGKQKAKYKILICGNHEVVISKQYQLLQSLCEEQNIRLLHNSHTVIEGHTIFGSPHSLPFGYGWAYQADEADLGRFYDTILPETSILVTHTPAYGNLDFCPNGHVGSTALKEKLPHLTKLKLHVTGHIHESRGTMFKDGFLTVNAAICGIPYTDIIINPITVEL